MSDIKFYLQLFGQLGFPCNPVNGNYVWTEETPADQLIEAIENLPDNESDFMSIDLSSSNIPAPSLSILQTWQCQRIRELRNDAYKDEADGLFFGAEADLDSRQAWLDKRAEIKARYPYPGTYR